MQVNISARHGHLSPGTQEKITEKVEVLRKYLDRITAIGVTVDLAHRDSPTVELRISAEHHDEFVAVDTAENVLTALDGVLEKMESQLRKFKEKLKEHRATSPKHIQTPTADE
ncbi:MAG: ribosome-associated translation inhibitor RaiA [Pirellulaceae bacterium]|nr:ribosome-associated translation inhibitor RaiA [Pirellulaceae bacterium]